jgi:hypothetical protein
MIFHDPDDSRRYGWPVEAVAPPPTDPASFDWLGNVVAPVAVGLLVLAVARVAVWAWRNRGEPGLWLSNQIAAADQVVHQIDADRLPEMRAQVGWVAKENGIRLAMKTTGNGNPMTVTWADGSMTQHYADWAPYKRENGGFRPRLHPQL